MTTNLNSEELYDFLKEDVQNIDFENAMINAAKKSGLTSNQLFKTNVANGLFGVYNLGMQHMYEYLRGDK